MASDCELAPACVWPQASSSDAWHAACVERRQAEKHVGSCVEPEAQANSPVFSRGEGGGRGSSPYPCAFAIASRLSFASPYPPHGETHTPVPTL